MTHLARRMSIVIGIGMISFTALSSGVGALAAPAQPSTAAHTISELAGVSCTSLSDCTAVGFAGTSASIGPFAEKWNGHHWRVVPAPAPAHVGNTILRAVSCTSPAACFAVGFAMSGTKRQTLAERWDGVHWRIVSTPNPVNNAQLGSALSGISCTSNTACTAVGSTSSGAASTPLVERWNGHSWTIQTAARLPGASDNVLLAVSCALPTACTAVGAAYFSGPLTHKALIEAWNGHSWHIQSTPNTGSATNPWLTGVSCKSTNACTAVGYDYPGNGDNAATLVERWNGHSWAIQTSTNPGGTNGTALTAVSCATTSNCGAVGHTDNGAIFEHWSGHSWGTQHPPAPPAPLNYLNGISCISTKVCVAVGYFLTPGGVTKTLIEGLVGTTWKIQASPN